MILCKNDTLQNLCNLIFILTEIGALVKLFIYYIFYLHFDYFAWHNNYVRQSNQNKIFSHNL